MNRAPMDRAPMDRAPMDKETLRSLSDLSGLGCSDKELDALLPDMEAILRLMDTIKAFSDPPADDRKALHLSALREDEAGEPADREAMLENAAGKSGGAFTTPRII